MKRKFILLPASLLILPVLLFSCAQVPKEAGFGDVQGLVGQRMDHHLHWNQGTEADADVETMISRLLETELTLDAVVQIALLNNPRLQATYEELGVTQADVVEAGLLKNPVFFGQARFPDRYPRMTNLEFGITQNFLTLLMLPARKKLATIQFERAKLRVADEVIALAADVQKSYYEVLAAKQVNQMRKLITEAAQHSYEMAGRLHGAGNISALALVNEQGQFEQTRIALAESETKLLTARERLTGLMGLWGRQTSWKIPGQLPDLPPEEHHLEDLEAFAIANRLDIAASRKEMEALAQALGITIDWRYFGSVEVGVSAERDTDGQWVVGPELALELPIFNQQQADIARLESQLRQSQKRLKAQAIETRSEIRSLRNQLLMTRNLIDHYRRVILPLRERIVHLTLQKYNYMLVGASDLLIAKQQEFDDYQKYIWAVRDYWIIRTELTRAAGGRLPSAMETGG
ncbi:MAG: TolC family protein [Desulfobacterales bacterium]|nr:MAG: TolC family protein [Desulfobacterales bacterium]